MEHPQILFHLNKETVEGAELVDFDYIATQDKIHSEITYVTWIQDGKLMEEDYHTDIVEGYFNEGLWLKDCELTK